MTDIDRRSDIGLNYHDSSLYVSIPLSGQVSETWCKRYEALAQGKDLQVMVRSKLDAARLYITLPARVSASEVEAVLETARTLIAEADLVDLDPSSSDSAEAAVRRWWAGQRT